ncbi:MAG: TIGR03118 family protein [Candidatus Sulfotelmatobacter sp.]
MSRSLSPILGYASSAALMLVLLSSMAAAQYKLTNLVSNQAGIAAHTDPLLVNAWGLVYGPGGPFWLSDNGSGWSTLYTASGAKEGLQVQIPTAGSDGPGSPTGIVFNGSNDFQVKGWPSIFLFATLDGTISGWAPQSNPNAAIVAVTTPGAVYTGLANTSKTSGNFLFAADNANNKVDVFDGSFKLVNSFTDTTLPVGFAPFGIQDFGGLLYVSFASSSGGPGGYIDIYSESGVFLKRLAQGGVLNQPWGFAIAPKNFPPFSNTLLVSNNTNSGTINAFNSVTGQFVGTIRDTEGKDIVINQLWAIEFGGGSAKNGAANELFFTAGPDNNLAGTFGKIAAAQP